ncbi:MAG: formylglycine-generating enzyme family protein [Kiritimatiellia bacterium]
MYEDDYVALKKTSGEPPEKEKFTGRLIRHFAFGAVVIIALVFGIWQYNQRSVRAAEERAVRNLSAISHQLFHDLMQVDDPEKISVAGLARGSSRAYRRQMKALQDFNVPLEVENTFAGIRFRLVPAGSFIMGSSRNEPGRDSDENRHEVFIDEPFYCSKFEITQRQWRKVMGTHKSSFIESGRNAPVENISWRDIHSFIDNLCRKSGVSNMTYRLLTEAQWEYACRAGTHSPLYTGGISIHGHNNAPELDKIAWYAGNSGVQNEEDFYDSSEWPEKQFRHIRAATHPAGEKMPNAFGLYDMIGNVWEWCADWYDDYSALSYISHPQGPASGHYRVIRGGAWNSPACKCRSAGRDRSLPDFKDSCLGFRIIRIIHPAT